MYLQRLDLRVAVTIFWSFPPYMKLGRLLKTLLKVWKYDITRLPFKRTKGENTHIYGKRKKDHSLEYTTTPNQIGYTSTMKVFVPLPQPK